MAGEGRDHQDGSVAAVKTPVVNSQEEEKRRRFVFKTQLLSFSSSCSILLGALAVLEGCGGHTERTLPMRTALDVGNPRGAIASLNEELSVGSDKELPKDLEGDNALLVLDRASIQQSLAQFGESKRDFEAADKAIDMLDLAHNAGDTIGKYVFSDSSGRYQAPPYEKLLINTLNLLNYLELHDLNGARVEARRLAVMKKYIVESLGETDNSVIGLGGALAGFAFEKSGEVDEALRWYDDALAFSGFRSLRGPVRLLASQGQYTSPRLKSLEGDAGSGGSPSAPAPQPLEKTGEGEILFVVGYGRVPHKIANRVPIGLALTYAAGAVHPNDAAAANRLAAQGLVTWINFPSLAPDQGSWAIPACQLDGGYVQLEESVNVSREVRVEWKKIEGQVIASAITRLVARYAAGEGVRAVAGKGLVGTLASLGTQATLTALDTPDTRSWETLPARVAVARVRVPAGKHSVFIDARGVYRRQTVDVEKGGWAVVSLMALR
jgi:hypothetical protein